MCSEPAATTFESIFEMSFEREDEGENNGGERRSERAKGVKAKLRIGLDWGKERWVVVPATCLESSTTV